MKIKKSTPLFIASLALTVFCMYMIFMFSYQNGDDSGKVSSSLYELFIRYTNFDFITHEIFRKLAHFSEFAALGFGACSTIYFYSSELRPLDSLLFSALYACFDEIHQLFVPERAGRIFDVFVDSCGAAAGVSIFVILTAIIIKIKEANHGKYCKQ